MLHQQGASPTTTYRSPQGPLAQDTGTKVHMEPRWALQDAQAQDPQPSAQEQLPEFAENAQEKAPPPMQPLLTVPVGPQQPVEPVFTGQPQSPPVPAAQASAPPLQAAQSSAAPKRLPVKAYPQPQPLAPGLVHNKMPQ